MPESGAWQPNTDGAQRDAAEDLVEQRQLQLAVALAAQLGPEVARPTGPGRCTCCCSGRTSSIARASRLVVRVAEHEVERLDLLAHERVDPVELRLELGVGLEVPRPWRVPPLTSVDPSPCQMRPLLAGDARGARRGRAALRPASSSSSARALAACASERRSGLTALDVDRADPPLGLLGVAGAHRVLEPLFGFPPVLQVVVRHPEQDLCVARIAERCPSRSARCSASAAPPQFSRCTCTSPSRT